MATRAESIKDTIAAEMVARGVDVAHHWGKQKDERHDRLPRVLWVEPDDDEVIEPATTTVYDPPDGESGPRDAVYERAVKVKVTVLAKDETASEVVMDCLIAAGRHKLTESAWEPRKIKKAGNRPSSGPHVRALEVVVRLPVFDITYRRGHIASVTTAAVATDAKGANPTPTDQP